MIKLRKILCLVCSVLLILSLFVGCKPEDATPSTVKPQQPISEHYEYTAGGDFCLWPSMVDRWVEMDALMTTTDDGTFYCYTQDTEQADAFVFAQRSLLRFLREKGIATVKMEFHATHYDDSFSESSEKAAYIALSAVRTWQQVLVTLQTLWGDYTDYGYIYTLSNAIAAELGWQTDLVLQIKQADLDAFFAENPAALQLLYPSFTTEYASEETVNSCKALSTKLFAEIDLSTALQRSVSAQLNDFYQLLSDYATGIGVPFARQTCGYSYYGERIPLRISTEYAKLYVDDGYTDKYSDYYDDYFSDYASIYDTAALIDQELRDTVVSFGLEDEAKVITINWISGDSADAKFGTGFKGNYTVATETVNVAMMDLYLFEYCIYLENLLNPDMQTTWQSLGFCDLAASRSRYYWYGMTQSLRESDQWNELFALLTDSAELTDQSFFDESNDILCYISGFSLSTSGANSFQSMSRFLVDQYGKQRALELLVYPETVEAVTGKNWDALADEWEQSVRAKYDGKELPDWVIS